MSGLGRDSGIVPDPVLSSSSSDSEPDIQDIEEQPEDQDIEQIDQDPQIIQLNQIMGDQVATGSQLSMIKAFSSEKDQDVEVWITQFERCVKSFRWSELTAANACLTKFEGAAAYWAHTLTVQGKEFPSWNPQVAAVGPPVLVASDGLKAAVLTRFKLTTTPLAAAAAVTMLQQGSMTVESFYDFCIVSIDRKNYNYSTVEKAADQYSTQFDIELYVFFSSGLRAQIRDRAMNGFPQPANIVELKKAALAAELFLSKQTKVPSAEINAIGKKPIDLDTLKKEIAALKAKLATNKKASAAAVDLTKIKCYNCQRFGHFADKCTNPHVPWSGQSGQSGQTGQGRGGGRGGRGFRGRGARGGRGRGRGWSSAVSAPDGAGSLHSGVGQQAEQQDGACGGEEQYQSLPQAEFE